MLCLLLSTPAFAEDVSYETVNFDAFSKFFRGNQVSQQYPSGGYVSLKFTIDIDSEVKVRTAGDAAVEWPENTLEHSFVDTGAAGQLLLKTDAKLKVDVAIDAFGYAFNYNLWIRDYVWTKTQNFTGLLLPGAANHTANVVIEESLPGVLTYDYYDVLGYPIDMFLTGDLYPTSKARVTGTHIRTDGKTIDHLDTSVVLTTPNPNPGYIEPESTWFGDIAADFETDIVATIEICENYLGWLCYPYTINEVWTLPTDQRTFKSDPEAYRLDIPALNPPNTTIDLGAVTVGGTAEKYIPLSGLSSATLRGTAAANGAGFSLAQGASWDTTGTGVAQLKVLFAPTEVGDFAGSITVDSNDPALGSVHINLTGEGVAEPEEEPTDTDDSGSPDETGLEEEEKKRCKCASTEPRGALALLPLLALALRRRRSA